MGYDDDDDDEDERKTYQGGDDDQVIVLTPSCVQTIRGVRFRSRLILAPSGKCNL